MTENTFSPRDLVFCTLAVPGESEINTLMLVRSIRSFGGRLAHQPILVAAPTLVGPLSDRTIAELEHMNATVLRPEIDPGLKDFPFAMKVATAALLEQEAGAHTDRLCFMDRDTLVLREPLELVIAQDVSFGYRPVHHKLIGTGWGEKSSPFWDLVFASCGVDPGRIFAMTTHTGERIQPYFNAGMFVIRPERCILKTWRDEFDKWCHHASFRPFYEENKLYAIFMHQAIFTAVILREIGRGQMAELSPRFNYPLHLHNDIPANERPRMMDELVTVRCESIFQTRSWSDLPMEERLRNWIASQLQNHQSEVDP